ncbi:hypothetical protein PN36_32690 [Candidatus Thiomargarita nelsonii]|uniref:Extracellular solute-binding protein n=1 Tax=Candidatus Thiomargarita nelsonii TaxID=1003181 RepID=A0A0A6PI00_9GAMM|nr:hypothetical protein PN36_32690 [Candidatus Thiomargarita nelsonii]
MNYIKQIVGLCIVLLATAASASSNFDHFQLRVSLYPWVPDAESLFRWIETDFESKHPDIDLVVRPLKKFYEWEPEYIADLSYEVDKTVSSLTKEGSDAQHLIEIDTIILGTLVEHNAVLEFKISGPQFLPVAAEAVTFNNRVYGVPHWTCGYFVISEDKSIRAANNLDALLETLRALGTEIPDIVGDLDGSWDSVMVYLDAYRDTYPSRNLLNVVSQQKLDPEVFKSFQKLGQACSSGEQNYCGSDEVERFATGNADALIGYSERLNPILAHAERKVANLHIASVPLGAGDNPTLFTDALVMSPKCKSIRCKNAATTFASYYLSDEVFEVVLMGLDVAPKAQPRYLLPSTQTAFEFGKVGRDQLYQELKEEIVGAKPYPNQGIPQARETGAIRSEVKRALGL